MKGISISPHILPLKPHPFTPLKRLGIPQTPIKAVENLLDFFTVPYGTFFGMSLTCTVILSVNFLEQKIEVEKFLT